jgi:hypothetical protein
MNPEAKDTVVPRSDTDPACLLLEAARGDLEALFRWYKALAGGSPFWARQQGKYTAEWGPQGTEIQPPTPWRVMSHAAETESLFGTEIGTARVALEFIGRLNTARELKDDTVWRLASEQPLRNWREIGPAAQAALAFFASGAKAVDLAGARSRVSRLLPGGLQLSRKLPKGVLRVLAADSRWWLSALQTALDEASAADATTGRLSTKRWHLALPFLHSAELKYLLHSPERSWRRQAFYLLKWRVGPVDANRKLPQTLARYVFGSQFAGDLDSRDLLNHEPITPAAPPYPILIDPPGQ